MYSCPQSRWERSTNSFADLSSMKVKSVIAADNCHTAAAGAENRGDLRNHAGRHGLV